MNIDRMWYRDRFTADLATLNELDLVTVNDQERVDEVLAEITDDLADPIGFDPLGGRA